MKEIRSFSKGFREQKITAKIMRVINTCLKSRALRATDNLMDTWKMNILLNANYKIDNGIYI